MILFEFSQFCAFVAVCQNVAVSCVSNYPRLSVTSLQVNESTGINSKYVEVLVIADNCGTSCGNLKLPHAHYGKLQLMAAVVAAQPGAIRTVVSLQTVVCGTSRPFAALRGKRSRAEAPAKVFRALGMEARRTRGSGAFRSVPVTSRNRLSSSPRKMLLTTSEFDFDRKKTTLDDHIDDQRARSWKLLQLCNKSRCYRGTNPKIKRD